MRQPWLLSQLNIPFEIPARGAHALLQQCCQFSTCLLAPLHIVVSIAIEPELCQKWLIPITHNLPERLKGTLDIQIRLSNVSFGNEKMCVVT